MESVQFQLDGQPLGSPDTAAPFIASWNTALAANGTHVLSAVARDTAGNTAPSAGVSITVANAAGDAIPPVATLTAPAAGAVLTGAAVLSATATDNVGVTSVQFMLDGQPFGASLAAAPYTTAWDTTAAANGTHALQVVARDAAGNTGTSGTVTVTVSNGTGVLKTLGHTTMGATTDSGAANYINAWRFQMPNESGTATTLSVYVGAVGASPNNKFQAAVYADVNGAPGALLASTASTTLTANAWNAVPLTLALQANASYWIAYNTSGAASVNNIRLDPGVSGQMKWRAQTFGTWPSTFGTVAGTAAQQASIYVTYKVP